MESLRFEATLGLNVVGPYKITCRLLRLFMSAMPAPKPSLPLFRTLNPGLVPGLLHGRSTKLVLRSAGTAEDFWILLSRDVLASVLTSRGCPEGQYRPIPCPTKT